MRGYVIRRLLQAAVVVFVALTLMFVIFRIVPSDPTAILVQKGLPEAAARELRADWGLTGSLGSQYVDYLRNLVSGDFGLSFFYRQPVWDILGPKIAATLVIAVPGMLLGAIIGAAIGMIGGWSRRGGAVERTSVIVATVIRGTPAFVLALALLIVFAGTLGWFPLFGMRDTGVAATGIHRYLSLDFLHHAVLPVLAVAIFYIPENLLLMRSGIVESRGEDYLEMLTAKGLRERRIRWHAGRNSLLPLITWLLPSLAETIAGIVVVEVVFSWPGVGRELVLAVTRQDFPIAQAAFFLMSVMIVVANLIADVLYGYLDPRVSVT